MKRTQYFQDRFIQSSIKRVTPDGKVTFFSTSRNRWRPSCYSHVQLLKVAVVGTTLCFNRITRDEARKAKPAAFKVPFNKA